MSNRARKMVQEWRKLHQEELLVDWKLVEERKELMRIDPLE